MENETLVSWLIAVIVLLVMGFGGYTYLEKREVVKVPEAPKSTVLKDSFMEGCVEESGMYVECSCMYDELLSDLGTEGFIKMSVAYDETGEFPEQAYGIIARCLE